jgi:hypothetical protein
VVCISFYRLASCVWLLKLESWLMLEVVYCFCLSHVASFLYHNCFSSRIEEEDLDSFSQTLVFHEDVFCRYKPSYYAGYKDS